MRVRPFGHSCDLSMVARCPWLGRCARPGWICFEKGVVNGVVSSLLGSSLHELPAVEGSGFETNLTHEDSASPSCDKSVTLASLFAPDACGYGGEWRAFSLRGSLQALMLPFFRHSSALFFFVTAVHSAFAQALPQEGDAEVQKALDGIPAELLPYVVVSKAAAQPPVRVEAAMDAAIRLAAQVDGDDDLRDTLLQECGRIAVHRGNLATAEEVAGMIRGHRAALLMLEIAERLLADGASVEPNAKAIGLLNKAGTMLPLLKPWQAQRVLAKLLVTGHRVRVNEALLASWWDQLKDKDARAEVAICLLARRTEEKGAFDHSLFQQEVARLAPNHPVPGYLEAAEDLLEQAEQMIQRKQDPQSILMAAFEVLKASNTIHSELLVRWAARFFQTGREDLARLLFERAEKNLGAPHEEVARLYYHVAKLWKIRGVGPAIQPRLDKVEKVVTGFEQVYLPFVCAWLSAAWENADDRQRAARMMSRAVQSAETNPNPRMRLAGIAQICLTRAAIGASLSDDAAALAAECLGTAVEPARPANPISQD